jgi:hypothetical protein
MRFFGNWCKRFPAREVAPTLVTALAVLGALADWPALINGLAGAAGFLWG